MKKLWALLRNEWRCRVRTGQLLLLLILAVLFGIMSPMIAKLTPWMFESIADSLSEQGIIVGEIKVTAYTAWQQYYKNMPIFLLIFMVLSSNVLTDEYQKGTLIPILTKGLPRSYVLLSKVCIQSLLWTLCYWLVFIVTYGYILYFWGNDVAGHWFLAAFYIWILGLWLLSVLFLASAVCGQNLHVLLFTGGVAALGYLMGVFSEWKNYSPLTLMNAGRLVMEEAGGKESVAAAVAAVSAVLFLVCAVRLFERRKI